MGQPVQFNTYDLTVGTIVDIEDMIHMLDPFEVPLLGQQGADGRSAISRGTCFEKQIDWLDEELLLPKATASAASTTGQTTLTVTSGHEKRLSTGDILLTPANEKIRVTGYSTNEITVTRSWASTTAATIASGAEVLVLGQALLEGSDPENPRAIDRSVRTNCTQIFGPTAVRTSATEQVVRKYGLSGTTEFDHQVANRTKEHFIQLEQAIQYGVLSAGSAGATEMRTMGGFTNFIATNTSTTQTLTETLILDQLQTAFNAGGRVDRVMCSPTVKRQLSGLLGLGVANTIPATTINDTPSSSSRGFVVDYYDSDFGRISILMNRWTRRADLFGWDRDQVELCTLRPTQFEMLAKTGDSVHGQIVGEYTLRFRRERHAFWLKSLAA